MSLWDCANPLSIRSKNRKEHTDSEWADLRPFFTDLYLSEGKPLPEVSRILREDWGFDATLKQYKDRVKKWGLRKNFKAEEKKDALAAGITSSESQLVIHNGNEIPEKRLRRYARDERLQYVQRLSASDPSPSPRTPNYDIVIEIPRGMIEKTLAPRAVHSALESLDELTKSRYPILNFSVLGISDAVVRYGLSYNRRGTIGMLLRPLPVENKTEGGKTMRSPGIGFRVPWKSFERYSSPPSNQSHVSILRLMCQTLYPRCQRKLSLGGNHRPLVDGEELSSVYDDPGQIRCPTFRATARAAQNLFLHLFAHSAVGAMARVQFEGISSDEMIRDLVGVDPPDISRTPAGGSSVCHSKVRYSCDLNVDFSKPDKTLIGTLRIPQVVATKKSVEAQLAADGRAQIPATTASLEASAESRVDGLDHYLLDSEENFGSIDSEFQAAAQRAAGIFSG